MPQQDVAVTGVVSTNFGATLVGSGAIWADGTDATYVHTPPGNGSDPGWGLATLAPGEITYRSSLRVSALVKCAPQFAGFGPGCSLTRFGSGGVGTRDLTQPVTFEGAWTLIPLQISSWEWLANLAEVSLLVGFDNFESSREWDVYEASVRFEWDGRRLPRRIQPRDDGLTGGAPRLSGSQSVQASNRLLGGYL